MKKGVDEGFLRWFCHVERMENDRIAKMVYVRECAGSRSVGRTRKRWIDTVKDSLKKRGLEIRRTNKTLNAWIRKLCRVRMKGLRKVFSNSSAMWRE